MSERSATPGPSPVLDQAGRSPSHWVRAPAGPATRQQRRQRIWDLQAEALERADPLAANLGALSGDLMLLALQRGDELREGTSAPAEGHRLGSAQTDQYLKVLRQLDRLVQVDQEVARAAPPAMSDHDPRSVGNGQTPGGSAAEPTAEHGSGLEADGRDAGGREQSRI